MHDDAEFLAAVAANPTDQLTRLVYADWLDERNDPRGELVRIEEEVRFEPAWSDVLWSQKPRRNELRAKCDPAWLQAMRYGTDCLPLFYSRPFPDHWRDGWRLIREATERWLGYPMPDVGGHADEIAAVEKRLGLTLPPSVREFVALAHDLPQEEDWISLYRDPYTMTMVPGHDAISLLCQAEGDTHWAVQVSDLDVPNPPITTYHLSREAEGADGEDEFVLADAELDPLPRFLFGYAAGYASRKHASMSVPVHDTDAFRRQLDATFPSRVEFDHAVWYEGRNISLVLDGPGYNSAGHLALQRSFSFRSRTYAAVSCGTASPARSAAGGNG